MGRSVVGIFPQREFQVFLGFADGLGRSLMPVLAASEVMLVGLDVFRVPPSQGLLPADELDFERSDHGL